MKQRIIALVLLFALALPLALTGCQSEQTQTDAPETDTPLTDAPETNAPETDVPEEFEIRRAADEIMVYPFTEDELDTAIEYLKGILDAMETETGVLTFDVERIAYDPILTDVYCRQLIADEPIDGWTEVDYYEHYICFTVTYRATYDPAESSSKDVEHGMTGIRVLREDVREAVWTYASNGVSIEEHSQEALSIEECKELTADDGRILAAYKVGENEYWLYVCDDATGEVRFGRQ